MNSTNTIGERIAVFRKAKGFTQEELASAIGVSAQSVSKWETGTTMPDILLLPVLADLFDVTVDALFGRTREEGRALSFNEVPEEALNALLLTMQRAFIEADDPEKPTPEKRAEQCRAFFAEHPGSQTQVNSDRGDTVYVSPEISFVRRMQSGEPGSLLENDGAAALLSALTDPVVRKVLAYQRTLLWDSRSYTAASVASRCGLSEQDAAAALETLTKWNLNQCSEVDTGENLLRVYRLSDRARMPLVDAILALAARLADFKQIYFCYRG